MKMENIQLLVFGSNSNYDLRREESDKTCMKLFPN